MGFGGGVSMAKTVWVVVLTDHGAIDADGIMVFADEAAARSNFEEVADDIQLIESDSFEPVDTSFAYSKSYAVTVVQKEVK